jgi:hypothetical protein
MYEVSTASTETDTVGSVLLPLLLLLLLLVLVVPPLLACNP